MRRIRTKGSLRKRTIGKNELVQDLLQVLLIPELSMGFFLIFATIRLKQNLKKEVPLKRFMILAEVGESVFLLLLWQKKIILQQSR